jgi:hypothetical protein
MSASAMRRFEAPPNTGMSVAIAATSARLNPTGSSSNPSAAATTASSR